MDIISNLLIGVVASVLTLLGDRFLRKQKLKNRFSPLAGKYAHYDLNDRPIESWETEIKYAGANVLTTHGKSSDEEWEGQITMNENNPDIGAGVYRYIGKSDCGLHEIQIDTKQNIIFVHWTNTSHGKNRIGSYVWKRIA